jgi:hypothetical protein
MTMADEPGQRSQPSEPDNLADVVGVTWAR